MTRTSLCLDADEFVGVWICLTEITKCFKLVLTYVLTLVDIRLRMLSMVKTLRPMGNSYGIIIDRPIMDLLGIEPDSQLEVTVEDGGLLLRPVKGHKARVRAAKKKVTTIHRAALKELAD